MALHYRESIAWQKAMDLVTEIYRLTATFPADERHRPTNQLLRASVTIRH